MCRRAPPMTCEKNVQLRDHQQPRGIATKFRLGGWIPTGGTDSGESKPSAQKCQFLLGFRLLYFGNIGKSENSAKYRHVPGSQPSFSLIQDPDQNKEDTSFIYVLAYGVYIPLSHPIQFCPFPKQNVEKNVQDPADPAEPWIQGPSGLLPIFTGFK